MKDDWGMNFCFSLGFMLSVVKCHCWTNSTTSSCDNNYLFYSSILLYWLKRAAIFFLFLLFITCSMMKYWIIEWSETYQPTKSNKTQNKLDTKTKTIKRKESKTFSLKNATNISPKVYCAIVGSGKNTQTDCLLCKQFQLLCLQLPCFLVLAIHLDSEEPLSLLLFFLS
jgi:hypothetical protein